MSTILYAWAIPTAVLSEADHTWVTSYPGPFSCPPPSGYWYCWGDCHQTGAGTAARLLGSQAGDPILANCICGADDPDQHGGINLYGIEGVCHQVANRILYSTGQTPLTVSGANMYWLSHLLFGTYGTTVIDWAQRKQKCISSLPQSTKLNIATTMKPADLALFDAKVKKHLNVQYTPEIQAQLHALQMELLDKKKGLDEQVAAGLINGGQFADNTNALLNQYLIDVGNIIGEENCRQIFNAKPGDKVTIINPQKAATVKYSK